MNTNNIFNNKKNKEHILVCISSSPSSVRIINTASKMAKAFNATLTALFIETPEFLKMNDEDKSRLNENIRYAQNQGANIETVCGDDIPYLIAEFARLSHVTKIVVGRSVSGRKYLIKKPVLTEKLIRYAPDIDIHIIPDSIEERKYITQIKKDHFRFSGRDAVISVLALLHATATGFIFSHFGFSDANIIIVYLLAVLVIAVLTRHKFYSLISSIVSVFLFNFFFTYPYFTLKAYDKGYPATFLIMFIVALISSNLAIRLKNNAKVSAQAAYRTKILLDTNQLLQKATDKNDIISKCAMQIIKLLNKDIIVYLCDDGRLSKPVMFCSDGKIEKENIEKKNDRQIAEWVMKNNHRAGATTEMFYDSDKIFFAIRVNQNVYGVVGIRIGKTALEAFENSILMSILGECAISLESVNNAEEKEKAAILAKNEQFRANLLRSISHDLRTPLTTISGNADNLLTHGKAFDEETKEQIYLDIYNDSIWLKNLMENLLSVTRFDDGKIKLNMTTELAHEIIEEALKHINNKNLKHEIIVECNDEMLFVKSDVKLIIQVIINLVDNAIKYTPDDSKIKISCNKIENSVKFSVCDNGIGISDEDKKYIFDMFYTCNKNSADARRSLGLGLGLCKSIISAHGGEIIVKDNKPKGTVFEFTLPYKEVNIDE